MTRPGDDLTPQLARGRTHYWASVILWWITAISITVGYGVDPDIGLLGKILIGVFAIGSAICLLRGGNGARYFAGTVALLAMMASLPGTCAAFDPESQEYGAVSLATFGLSAVVWHAFLISQNVNAYLRHYRAGRNRGEPELETN